MSGQTRSATEITPGALFRVEDYRMCESMGYLIGRTKTALSMAIEQEVAQMDVTHSQASCLMLLANGRCQTATDLGRELNTDIGSLTRMLSRMEKRGLIERARSESDRRVVHLELTDAGRTLAERMPAIYTQVLNRFFAGFTQTEVQTLRGLLQRVLDNGTDAARMRPADA
ncbi:MarR family winged helix-turn-helix transcriptional regulator [Ralstonia solanacearum]|uniref:MarR family winged helix-turn-helix transcriptional regulator n=1 Tax=Ralstonia solanacearum TaxID=305 RepID=UPI00123BFCE6|nr:MarR family transcriptional regulator [Ralstonia solanacearum]AYB51779.1 MarR family transcriptional regulator [Ralstonia solanacearum]AYB56333.1 MarR family transcriptional regulator [Ralstonia solanacearum]